MLKELEREKYNFSVGKADFYLRFDNKAVVELEKLGYSFFDVAEKGFDLKSAKCFLLCGLRDWFDSCGIEDLNIVVNKITAALSPNEISEILIGGFLLALPKPVLNSKPAGKGEVDFSRVFYCFCDIMGKPESLFWELTLREVCDRWDSYAVFHGYKEAPITVRRYDD